MPARIIPLPKAPDDPKRPPREVARDYLQQALNTGIRGELRDAIQAALDLATTPRKRDVTELQYDSLKPGQKLLDGNRPGFLARATRRGTRFAYRYSHPETGKQIELALGYLGDISLKEARETWENLRAQRMAGKVPSLVEEAAAGDLPTIGKLCRLYLDEYASKTKRSWKDDERLLNRHILPSYAEWPADQFTTEEARRLFRSLDGTPRERDKLRAVLQVMFNVALGRTAKLTVVEPWLPVDFQNPIANATTAAHRADVYFPAPSEARAYFRGLQLVEMREDYRDALTLQLLTASRIAEIVELRWREVDLAAGTATIAPERSKNGREHAILLSPPALEILKRRAEWKAPADEFVFPAEKTRAKAARPDLVAHALSSNRKALGVSERFTSHNVRHGFTTWAAEQGAPVEVVNRCTAHVVATGINARYNAARLNGPAADLWTRWAEWLRG